MLPEWLQWTLFAIVWNWAGSLVVTWAFLGWCWAWGNLRLEGWIYWRGWFPVARFRLTDKKGWFRSAWEKFYGHAFLGGMIHRDEVGKYDDIFVDETIVHELRHGFQQLALGLLFYVAYGVLYAVMETAGDNGYHDNPLERDARAAAKRWVDLGRPRRFRFGRRR